MKRNYQSYFRLGSAMLVALSTTMAARADYQSTVISQNPAGYYRLNETVQPQIVFATNSGSLGSAANGTYENLPTLNSPGPFAGSVSVGLDGTAQYISTPWSPGLNTSSFSFEIWEKPGASPKFAYLASSVHITSPRSGWYLAQDDGSTFGYGPAWVLRIFNTNGTAPSLSIHVTNAPSSVNAWMHLVVTYNGTTASLYTNGVLATSAVATLNGAGLGYIPNVDSIYTVGARSSQNFFWPGLVAETAIYPTALSASRVLAHYTAGTTTPGSYASTVLADSPLNYDRYQAPPNPVAANLGTLGSAGNGLYVYDAFAGANGPSTPTYPGFAAGNKSAAFDAGGGAVVLPQFNFNTNTVTISGWINASNAQEIAAGLVVCDSGSTYAGLTIDGSFGGLGLGYVWNNDPNTYGWSPSTDAGLPNLPDSAWAFVALVIEPTRAEIYLASTNNAGSFTSVTNEYPNINQAFDASTLIGTDAGLYSFNGAIDEVAIWNRSLGSGELYSQYASAVGGLPPIVFSGPNDPDQPIVEGDTLVLSVNAGGTPNLNYQWFSNSVAIPLATNSVYSKPDFSIASDTANYFAIITNNFGSATSQVAHVTGQLATAPVVISGPVGGTIYPGGILNLKVVATGGGLKYQWKTNNTPIPGATKANYTVAGVSTNDAGSYSVSVTNTLGSTNLGPAVVSVPYLVPGSYAAVVDADAPISWWRLDDTVATNGALMSDALNRNSGTYTNVGGLTVGNPGAITGGLAGTAITFSGAGSYGSVPFFSSLATTKFSLEVWVKQTSVVNSVTAVSSWSAEGGYAIGAGSYWQGQVPAGSFGQGPGVTAGYNPTIIPNQWVHIVITHNPTVISGTTYAYQIWINGVTDGSIWGDDSFNTSYPFIVGGRGTGLASVLSRFFNGSVDEIAFYDKVLSSSQIQAHYAAAFFGVPATIAVNPLSQNAFAGENVTLTTEAAGAPPIAYQWKKNGANIAGATNSTYTVSNITYSANTDVYSVGVTNSFGGALSSGATITVYVPPTYANLTNGLILHLTFDGNYNDTSGQGNNGTPVGSPALVAGKIGSGALSVSTDTTNAVYNYVTLGNPSDFQFGSSGNFSFSYWCKLPPGYVQGDLPFLSSSATSYGGYGITFAPSYQRGGWSWSLANSVPDYVGIYGNDNSINDGNWHQVVETFDRNGNGITYLDGALVSTVPINGIGNINSGGPFNIGQGSSGTYSESGGFILDDIGMWNRTLTDVEARSIYVVGNTYGQSFDVYGPVNPTANIYKTPSGNVGISWQTGTLVQSGAVTGPWTPVPGATIPFYQIPPATTNTFYKVQP